MSTQFDFPLCLGRIDICEMSQNETKNYETLLVELKSQIVVVLMVLGVLSVVMSSIVIFVMLNTQKLRKNSANVYIFAILAIDLLFGATMPFVKKVMNVRDFYDESTLIFSDKNYKKLLAVCNLT